MAVYHKILVPLDRSALADRVLDVALATARSNEAELVLLHVRASAAALDNRGATQDLDAIEREVSTLMARARARPGAGGVPMRGEVRSGDVVDAVVAAVEELHVDLVVMGSHGRSGLLEQITGSTTEQALGRLPVSVFVVRPAGFPYLTD